MFSTALTFLLSTFTLGRFRHVLYLISPPISPGLISEFVRLFDGPICKRAYPPGGGLFIWG